jgi:AcrR family transcriptional regulator
MHAAMQLIAEKGFKRTTAAEIGERAGFSRNMVRDRYGSKDGLLESLCREEFGERLLPASRGERTGNGLSLVLGQLDDLLLAAQTSPESLRAVIVIALEAPGQISTLRGWWAEMITRYEDEMVEHLNVGQRDHSVHPDLDPQTEAEIFVSYGAGLCFRWVLEPDTFDFTAEVRAWRDRLEKSYAAQEAGTRRLKLGSNVTGSPPARRK